MEVAQGIGLGAALLFLSAWGAPLGGVLYALCTLPMRLPLVGPIYRFVINGPIKLTFVMKSCAWMVSGLTPAFLAAGLEAFAPWPLEAPHFAWAMLIAGAVIVCNEMARVVLFETPDYYILKSLPEGTQRYITGGLGLNEDAQKRLARSQFVDMTLIGLLKVVCGFSLMLMGLQSLGYVSTPESLTMLGSLVHTAALLSLFADPGAQLSGPAADILQGMVKFSAFIYIIFFVSLASTLVDDSHRNA